MIITGIMVALALIGAYAILINIFKTTYHLDHEAAKRFVNETILDILYSRSDRWLHCTDFPTLIYEDIRIMHTEETKKQWKEILSMKSLQTQWWGSSSDGVAFYGLVVPWDEDYKHAYSQIISNAGRNCLNNMHCTINDVIVDFFEWNMPGYRICRIQYARTAAEQSSFKRLLIKKDTDNIGGNISEVHDPELDEKLKLFGDQYEEDAYQSRDASDREK